MPLCFPGPGSEPEPHLFRAENAPVHDSEVLRHGGPELHTGQNVLFQIHVGGDLGQLQAVLRQAKYCPLRDVDDLLPGPAPPWS